MIENDTYARITFERNYRELNSELPPDTFNRESPIYDNENVQLAWAVFQLGIKYGVDNAPEQFDGDARGVIYTALEIVKSQMELIGTFSHRVRNDDLTETCNQAQIYIGEIQEKC